MAGNIIPAIATTNAVVAAMIVMEALKILRGRIQDCKSVPYLGLQLMLKRMRMIMQIFVVRKPNPRGKILVDMELAPPRPACYVCAAKPAAEVRLNVHAMTVKGPLPSSFTSCADDGTGRAVLEEKVLKGELAFVSPDVGLPDGSVIISGEPGETERE